MPIAILCWLLLLVSSCTLAPRTLQGSWRPDSKSSSRLYLDSTGRFDWALLDLHKDSLLFPGLNRHGRITGTWELRRPNTIWFFADSIQHSSSFVFATDSIARFTSISSFQFINRFGDPVSIRQVVIPPARPKPHYGNSLYYFAQDIPQYDTLRFLFDGFPPVSYPGTIAAAIGNNLHKVTLHEPYLTMPVPVLKMKAHKNRLVEKRKKILYKKVDK
ncbi:MAG: hypothetical protein QM781_13770 [Chitinophagaceae bacterium]